MMEDFGIPEILESDADAFLKSIYSDIKQVLQVPNVNFIFRTLAWYEDFLSLGWKQVRPNLLTFEAKRAAETLRYPDIGVDIPVIDWNYFYEKPVLDRIRSIVSTFNQVNPKLLLIASAWSESLAGRPNKGTETVKGTINPGVEKGAPSIDMVNIPQAPQPTQFLLRDIAEQHHHYDAASDFRALARYPQFLRTSWSYLRNYVGTRNYGIIREKLLSDAVSQTKQLPYPVSVNRKMLGEHYSPAEIAGIIGIVSMFRNLLPDLIIDGEFFRRILIHAKD